MRKIGAYFKISFLAMACILYVSGYLFSQDIDRRWNTLVVIRTTPQNADKKIMDDITTSIQSKLTKLTFARITYIQDSQTKKGITEYNDSHEYERVMVVTITEVQKEKVLPGNSGANKYILKKNPPQYEISTELFIPESGERITQKDKFSGYSYNPEGNIFVDKYADYFDEKPLPPPPPPPVPPEPIQKKKEPVFKNIYLSTGLALEIPVGAYSSYAYMGGGFHFEGGSDLTFFPNYYVGLSMDMYEMATPNNKNNPYYKIPIVFLLGHTVDIPIPRVTVLPLVGIGVLMHDMDHSTYIYPEYSVHLRFSYFLNDQSSVYAQFGYKLFYNKYNNGSSICVQAGYTYHMTFIYDEAKDTFLDYKKN